MKRLSPSLLGLLLFVATIVSGAEPPTISKGLVQLTLSGSNDTVLEVDCTFGAILCPLGDCRSETSSKRSRSRSLFDPPVGGDNEETRLVISNEGGPNFRAVETAVTLKLVATEAQGRTSPSPTVYSVQIEEFQAYGVRHLVLNAPECGRWSAQVSLNRLLVPPPVPLNVTVTSGDGSGRFSAVIPIPLIVTFRDVVAATVVTETVMVDLYLQSNYALIESGSPGYSNFVPFVKSLTNEFLSLQECAVDLRHAKASFCFQGNVGLSPLW